MASVEEERKKAAESLSKMLSKGGHSKPRNFREGLGAGVGNIVGGAVGAAGIAVLAPTVGLFAGTKHGGILGGIVGVTGGALIGAVGAVALAVGGAVSGVTQVVQGTTAIPAAIQAQRKGQWWNEVEARWVTSNLEECAKDIEKIDVEDRDILKDIENKIDNESVRPSVGDDSKKKTVKDMKYYDILDVDPNAEPSAIKRRYYVLARKYHPDKLDKDDKEGAAKFQDIAEAYQVLSNPTLRKRYDEDGAEGLSADRTTVAEAAQPKLDPALLFTFLFGSDKFKDYLGRLATATSAKIGDSNELSKETARLLQIRRVKRLAVTLAVKLQNWVDAAGTKEAEDACKAFWADEAKELSTASYGHELVQLIGQIYNLNAVQFLGSGESGTGLPSISDWAAGQKAKLDARKTKSKTELEGLTTAMDMMQLQAKYQVKMKEAKTDEERANATKEMEDASAAAMLALLWTTLVVDVTSTIHEVTQMVFHDEAVEAKVRETRAHGLKELGQVFMDCPEPDKDTATMKQDAKAMYEEAAFNAMLQTMKRKEEAEFNASRNN